MVNDTLVAVPEDGALPLPVKPVATYRTPLPPVAGEDTVEDAWLPAAYHPSPVGESYGDITFR